MNDDRLIYGKDNRQKIVSIEVDDSANVEIFYHDGSTEVIESRFWILAANETGWKKLDGNLHYKYGKQFADRQEFEKARNFLKHKDIFSIYNRKEATMCKDGFTYFKGLKHKDVSALSFDIETTSLEHTPEAKVLLIANTFRDIDGTIIRKQFKYDDYVSEGRMIEDWCTWVRAVNPSILLGHNIYAYDLPYLAFIANKFNATLKLGRDGSDIKFDKYDSKFRKDQTQFIEYKRPHCYGREFVDTLFLAIKYDVVAKKYESYALKKIIDAEGITQPGRVFYDAAQIRHKYKDPKEWLLIQQYAMFDGDDALALYDLFSPPYFYMTQSVPKSFQSMIESASGSQINSMMVRSYLQEGHSLPKAHESADYQGAISLGHPGIYDNVYKVDVASLYPNIMLQYEVYDAQKDPKKNFLQLVQTFTTRRLKHKALAKKDKYYDDLQAAEKIFINSCYGFLGTAGLLFNSPTKASFVTETGRNILQQAIDWAVDKEYQIVNADTDSISFNRPDGASLSEEMRKSLLDDLNSKYPERIKFEDDGYYLRCIVFKAKNYVLWDGKKIKTKGSALRASTKESRLKDFINDSVVILINSNNAISDLGVLYNSYVVESQSLSSIHGWTVKKSITKKVMTSERTNETKVLDAIAGTEIVEGDKCQMFFREDDTLCLEEHFKGDYSKDRLAEKIYKTLEIFDSVVPMDSFPNYKLKRNKKALQTLMDNAKIS